MRTYLHEIISDRLHDGWQNECARCFCFLSCVVFASTKSMDGLLLSNFDAYARAHRVRRINTCMFENVAGYRRTCSLLHCVSLLIFFFLSFLLLINYQRQIESIIGNYIRYIDALQERDDEI